MGQWGAITGMLSTQMTFEQRSEGHGTANRADICLGQELSAWRGLQDHVPEAGAQEAVRGWPRGWREVGAGGSHRGDSVGVPRSLESLRPYLRR